uniref:Uncharacterized protein n=1 Tax=Anopheles farauti TaxID=69004 RepID=A0A182QV53_9DIPT
MTHHTLVLFCISFGGAAAPPSAAVGVELSAQEFFDRLLEYTDLNTRIDDQQQEQLDTSNLNILHSQYVQITPIEPAGAAGGGATDHAGELPDGTQDDAGTSAACHGEASGSCRALIFRETTV